MIIIDKSLLTAACAELRKYAIPAGADDQVVLNIEAALANSQHDELVEAAKEFIRKCDAGEARSKRSYAAFKAALNKLGEST